MPRHIINPPPVNILIVHDSVIPAMLYGGVQRDIWYLGKELVKMGHKISYLVEKGSHCEFGDVLIWDRSRSFDEQIPSATDIVNMHFPFGGPLSKPYVAAVHGNRHSMELSENTIFVSRNHASRFNAQAFVYNGMDWDDYGDVVLGTTRRYFHFLGKASWRVKNVKGAINIINKSKGEHLKVLGGRRLNIKMGFRFTFSPKVSFEGMVGGVKKNALIQASKGLIFPVRWHEPMGLAIPESLYFGCPVFGTPYGSLPELITTEFGFLSNKSSELIEALKNVDGYSREKCHEYARDMFNSKKMAESYLNKFEKVLNGEKLNPGKPELIETQETKFLDWHE